ncbi:Bacterial protein of uncharacterised function (DUF945) [Pragia fontium]|uniref:YdgA family protein n=1 Tax=Pragia fontium TaxID=82985 RepID=UPI000E00A60C|nr:YdgA family protein [Pragia fontium]SUB82551.1 Bacterial protein of uncharacterised function (DUF945) [Pragia fontium]
MKKSIVAVGVLVVLGGAWVGGSWYTGKVIQSEIEKSLVNAQKYIEQYAPEYKIKMNITDYQRGVFSSQVSYAFDVANGNGSDSVSIAQKISHGPFPLDHFSLSPKLAFSKTELIKQPSLDSFFDMAGGKSPLNVEVLASYDGSSEGKVVIEPLTDKSDGTFKFSGLTLNVAGQVKDGETNFTMTSSPFDMTEHGSQVSYDMAKVAGTQNKSKEYTVDGSLGKLTIAKLGDEGEKEQIILNNLTVKSQGKAGKFDMNLGLINIALQNVTYTINDKPKMVMDGLTAVSNVQEDEKFINQVIDTTIGQLNLEGKNLGSGSMKVKLDRFDGGALQYLNKNSDQLAYLYMAGATSPQGESNLMMNNLMTFLDANPTISITPLTWKNDKGESQIDMALTLMRPASLEFSDMTQLLLNSVKQFNSSTKLSVPMLTEMTKLQYELSGGLSAEDSQTQATASVQQTIDMGIAQKMLSKKDDNTVTSYFNYADGMLDLNGQKMPAEQFINMFMMPGIE